MRAKKNRQNVLVSGSAGRMGREICSLLTSHPQLVLGASVDRNEIKAHDLKHTAVLKPTQSSLNAVMAGVDKEVARVIQRYDFLAVPVV
ncbi:MAG: hypothetical protein WCL28_11930, partial [bacterium]